MRKIIFTICLLSLLSTTLRAEITRMDGNALTFGVGFGWIHKEATGNGATNFPSINIRYERGIHLFENVGVITVGGQFGLHSSYLNSAFENTPELMQNRRSWTSFYLLPTAQIYFHEFFYHQWGLHRDIELYFGLSVGGRFTHQRTADGPIPPAILSDATPWNLAWNVFLGGRYAINQDFAVFAEFGWGLSIFNVGATIAF